MTDRRISRRNLLGLAGLGLGGVALAACSPKSTAASSAAQTTSSAAAPPTASSTASSSTPTATPSPTPTPTPSPTGAPVHVRLYQADGSTYGVGMPIIAYLSASITDGSAFSKATTVTVNGTKAAGAWYFQRSGIYAGYPIEAHYRLQHAWPAHAKIEMDLATKGLSAGTGLVFDDSLTLSMATGARNITSVDGKSERMVVTTDGKPKFSFPVSLGAADTPTYNGIKVVMELDKLERMVGDDYDVLVPWSVRLTNSGEFIHAASWNTGNIGSRSTSHGCTNLDPGDAEEYFGFAKIGDLAVYTNTGGSTMPTGDGYGDWNVAWPTWQRGGVVPV